MSVKVHKWENSSAVPVPSYVREKLGIYNGSEVEIEVRDNEMVVRPVKDSEKIDPKFISFLEETAEKYETVTRNLVDR